MKAMKVSQAKVHQPEKKAKKKVDFKYILLAVYFVGLLISRTDNMYAWLGLVVLIAFVSNDNTKNDEDYDERMWELVDDPKFSSLSGNLFHND